MTDKDRIDAMIQSAVGGCYPYWSTVIAGYLVDCGVVMREKGEWVLGKVEPGYCTPGGNRPWICSNCGSVISWHLDKPTKNFCPNCGSDMREETIE